MKWIDIGENQFSAKQMGQVLGQEKSYGAFEKTDKDHKDYEYSELLDRIESIMNEKNG